MKEQPRVLPLRFDVLENPTRFDLALIEAWMLWPDDENARSEALASAYVESEKQYVTELSGEDLKFFTAIASGAFPPHHIQGRAKDEILHGAIAGMVLREAVGELAIGHKGITLSGVFKRISLGMSITQKVFDNSLWRRFRPVAHLWAAWLTNALDDDGRDFPCELSGLASFLQTAEDYRMMAENHRTKQSRTTILRIGEAVGIPLELGIAPRAMSFSDRFEK
jgi:hypothetical protein